MIAHITQSLHYDAFSFYTQAKSELIHDVLHIAHFPKTIEHTQAGGFLTAAYTALRYWFTRYTTQSIYFAGTHTYIGIGNPGHFAFAGSIVRSGNIDAGTDKIFLDQLRSITP